MDCSNKAIQIDANFTKPWNVKGIYNPYSLGFALHSLNR